MEERRAGRQNNHSILLENREKLNVSGVDHVNNFNDETIILETVAGVLTIKGRDLDVNKLNIEDGNISISGNVNSLTYSEKQGLGERSSGFLGKILK